jgi:hypothetical protein
MALFLHRAATGHCPITLSDISLAYNQAMRFKAAVRNNVDFWNGNDTKAIKGKFKAYQAQNKFRLDRYLIEPFELETAPATKHSGLVKSVGSPELIDSIPHKFDAADIR